MVDNENQSGGIVEVLTCLLPTFEKEHDKFVFRRLIGFIKYSRKHFLQHVDLDLDCMSGFPKHD